jgi:RNA polymerase sigma-70 factor (ECF subfamily)
LGSNHQTDAAAWAIVTLEELMTAYQRADPQAVTALIDRVSPQLHRFFAGQMGSGADADDMLQETWLRIHRIRHTYRPGAPVLPWLYAIAHRVRIDSYRRRRRVAQEVVVEGLPERAGEIRPEPDGPRFEEMVAELPESQREVISMLKVDGFSIDEIAKATDSTPGAVKQKAHRAYTRLRAVLQEAGFAAPRGVSVSWSLRK